jgi:site-specific recombinase XerC
MRKYSPENERIKRQYFAYLKEAKRHSEPTVDAAAKALHRFEEYTKFRSFKLFHTQQAIAFKNYLAEQKGLQSGEKLSKATLYATLTQLKRFFQWLAREPGYSRAFSIPTLSISTCPTRTRGLRRPSESSERRPWNRSSTSSKQCRRGPRSSDATMPSSPSPS